MQKLIRFYIKTYSEQSVKYEDFIMAFVDYLDHNFPKLEAEKIKSKMDWDAWVKGPGLAPV